jgi:hypothetical protein
MTRASAKEIALCGRPEERKSVQAQIQGMLVKMPGWSAVGLKRDSEGYYTVEFSDGVYGHIYGCVVAKT